MPESDPAAVTPYLSYTADFTEPAIVSAYDQLPLWSSMFGLMLLEHLPLHPGAAILDVGCGTGFPLLELAQRCGPSCRAYGLDPWTEALARASAKRRAYRVNNAALVHGDAAVMPFVDASFDLVVSNLGVNNFDAPAAALAECARVLKPSGTIALTTNLRGHMQEFYAVFESTLANRNDERAIAALRRHIDHRVTVAQVRDLFAAAGLAVTNLHGQTATMRFADGTALLNHDFIKLGFLDAWKQVVDEKDQQATFAALERNLNEAATSSGELTLTIPMAYIEGKLAASDPTSNL